MVVAEQRLQENGVCSSSVWRCTAAGEGKGRLPAGHPGSRQWQCAVPSDMFCTTVPQPFTVHRTLLRAQYVEWRSKVGAGIAFKHVGHCLWPFASTDESPGGEMEEEEEEEEEECGFETPACPSIDLTRALVVLAEIVKKTSGEEFGGSEGGKATVT